MPRTPIGHTVGDWVGLTTRVTPEIAAEHPSIQYIYEKLVARLAEIQELIKQRDFYEARKQETSKQINKGLPEGRREATLLRIMLKQHYGPESEQLAAFDIQPFRGRKPRRKNDAPPPETPEREKPK